VTVPCPKGEEVMFDPSVYENLKVVVEGAIYDLDLDGGIQIINRKDIVDLASIARTYEIEFTVVDYEDILVHFILKADLASFAQEKIKRDSMVGCELFIIFSMAVKQELRSSILQAIQETWEERPTIEQKVVYSYPTDLHLPMVESTLTFNRKITEDQLPDIPSVLEHTIRTVEAIKKAL
jgi:hypothetical protein